MSGPYKSEKNFLERIADSIPGLSGYRERESRRDTDKRLRDHLARRLDRSLENLDSARREATAAGDLEPLDEIGRLDRRLRRASDSLRHASYGYTGAFDQVRMRDEELERIYRFDLGLLDHVEAVERATAALSCAAAAIAAAAQQVDRLLEVIEQRREIFETPISGIQE